MASALGDGTKKKKAPVSVASQECNSAVVVFVADVNTVPAVPAKAALWSIRGGVNALEIT